ncbi:MAG TPA: VOC family protein [Bacteroidia bacterium]|nr:VOC family protein [Bacteroidia bacterium]
MQKIVPFLWFDNNAEDAIRFYTSVFKDSKIIHLSPMVSIFELNGQQLMAINGGPQYKLTEAFSLMVNCETQEEVDYYWEKLCEGGSASRCGWLKDKYGLSWQIVPTVLGKLMSGNDPERAKRVMNAVLQMSKLDIATLESA